MHTTLLAITFTILVTTTAGNAAAQPAVSWSSYTLETSGGGVSAQIGRIKVPERRSAAGSRAITLAFVKLSAIKPSGEPPVLYLDGGPGGGGFSSARLPEYWALYDTLRATRDVILLSQRGTGLSDRIGCRESAPFPDDTFVNVEKMREQFEARYRACASSLRAQGADPGGYNTEESADDVEAVRQALGVPKLALLGFSYGTHLGLTVIRRHGAHIDRAVFLGVEGPDDTWKLPAVYDAQVDAIAALVKADPQAAQAMPDLPGELKRLLDTTRKTPIELTASINGAPRQLLIGADGILMLLRRDIGDTNDTPWIPAFVYDTAAGDRTMLRRLVERRIPGLESGINMMAAATDCASGASSGRLAEIRRQEPLSIFGPLTNFPFPDICSAAGVQPLPDAYRTPVTSDVPVLFVSGTLDSNTPPGQAERVLRGFSRGAHIIVRNAGHESTMTAEVRGRIAAFFRGTSVPSATLDGGLLTFTRPR